MGKVTDYEWIKKAQPAQTQQTTSPSVKQGSQLPDPNTPPILYGDDYPGPDEPLYQPEDDEQIWLTDLEGHGDIYDNDSIKINYAPGFDKSQITKIDVYRNGVIMRFLPDTFDVLANAQMKTFDGNPLEHSPASNHTDHAIMGYEYEFKIQTADHLWILEKTVKSGFRWRPKESWAGMDHDWNESMEHLSYDDLVSFFAQLREDGFTGISFNMSYYVYTPSDSDIFELSVRDPRIAPWNMRSSTLEELDTLLKAITQAGLQAKVMTMFYVSESYVQAHTDRYIGKGMMDPQDPQLFFDNYTKLLERIIPTLNKYSVMSLTVLDETSALYMNYAYYIKNMLDTLASKFTGELAIDIAGNNILTGDFWNPNGSPLNFREVIDRMSFLGWTGRGKEPLHIEQSNWTPPLETQSDQRASVMEKDFVNFWKPLWNYISAVYPAHQQAIGEMGTYNVDGVAMGNSVWNIADKRMDDQELSDVWYVYLRGAAEVGFNSVNMWIFLLGEVWSGESVGNAFLNTGFRHPESPAYRVITAIIKPAGD